MPRRIPTFRAGPPKAAMRRRSPLDAIYSKAHWQRFRRDIRAERVLCERCSTPDRPVVGTIVHHKIDPRKAPDQVFDPDNVELLCASCHNKAHPEKSKSQ